MLRRKLVNESAKGEIQHRQDARARIGYGRDLLATFRREPGDADLLKRREPNA